MNRVHLIFTATDKEWLTSLLKSDDHEEVSHAAKRLYDLGEQDLALETLLGQLKQSKNALLHKVKRDVTCFLAMNNLGFIKDERAAPDLIEALDVYTVHAASALGKINGEKLRRTLHELSKLENRKGLGAILALGYMKDKEILPTIIAIVQDMKSYEKKYLGESSFDSTYAYQFMAILGEYDTHEAKRLFNEMRNRVMLWGYEIMESTDKEWLTSLSKTETPINVRSAAARLYEIGEEELGLKTLLDQMNQYKDPNTHRNTLSETCPNAIIDLGILGDERAIPDLIEALSVYTTRAAFALASINGSELKMRLRELAKTDDIKGFGAILALGYMKDLSVLPAILDISNNVKSYLEKYMPKLTSEAGMLYFSTIILPILGAYDNPLAERLFLETIKKDDIRSFILSYGLTSDVKLKEVYEEIKKMKPDIKIRPHTQKSYILDNGHIIKKFGWDQYLDKPDVMKILTDNNLQKWDKEINALVDLIWDHVQRKREPLK